MISKLTLGERHFGLLLVERIKLRIQRIGECLDLAVGMKLAPWVAAGIPFAGFQDHHEGVETIEDLGEWSICDLVVAVSLRVCR